MDNLKEVTASSVAEALAQDYFSIYYVNALTDEFVEYSSSKEYEKLGIETSGKDFFNLSRKNIDKAIYSEDRDMFLESFTKEKVLMTLFTHRTFTLTYRLLFDGVPKYVHMKATRMKERDDYHIVVGVSDIDDQMKAKEAYEKAHTSSLTYSRITQALADDYFSIYCINVEDDSFIEYSTSEEYEKLGIEKDGKDFFNVSRKNILRIIHQEDQERFLQLFTKENLIDVLSKYGTFTMTYRLLLSGLPTWVSMKATKLKNDDKYIVIGVNNIDLEVKRKQEFENAQAERITYSKITQALAKDYFSIYIVDLKDDTFKEYSSTSDYKKLGIETEGTDFFNLSRKNVSNVVYPDDRELFSSVFTKENLLNELANLEMFTLRYRIMFGDDIKYVTMKATLLNDEYGSHMVIGVNNIDAQIRREQEYNKLLSDTREKVNRDPLTGVKSKHAYNEYEKKLNHEILDGVNADFSVVVCDVNGLKTINDTLGHKAGDKYICDACKVICNIFDHSPVFRIGGDEFVIITTGNDNVNIKDLIGKVEEYNQESLKSSGIVIACGYASFDDDSSVASVFERADKKMYENKKLLKEEK